MDSVVDEVIGAAVAGGGIIGGSYAMQMLRDKLKLNPWLVSGGGFAIGFGGRLASNMIKSKVWRDVVKDLSTGIMTAGALDAAKKTVDILFPAPAPGSALETLKKAVPQLSGTNGDRMGTYNLPDYTGSFRGMRGMRGIDSNILNGGMGNGDLTVDNNNSNLLQ